MLRVALDVPNSILDGLGERALSEHVLILDGSCAGCIIGLFDGGRTIRLIEPARSARNLVRLGGVASNFAQPPGAISN